MRTAARVVYAAGGALAGVLVGLVLCGLLFALLGIEGGFGLFGVVVCALLATAGARAAWSRTSGIAPGPAAGVGETALRRAAVLAAAAPSALLVAAGDWPAALGGVGLLGTLLPFVLARSGWYRHVALGSAVALSVVGLAYAGAFGAGLPVLATAALLALTAALVRPGASPEPSSP